MTKTTKKKDPPRKTRKSIAPAKNTKAPHTESNEAGDPLWYKKAVIYQLHIRAFYDSNGDGIGDFRGLTEKLDYLQDLGVTAIWMLPFYPSPLRDDGYDIADYTGVNQSYGTMRDVRRLIREAHKRGLKVITELVLNHTSDQHAWFQRARKAPPDSTYRDFYVWSDSPDKYDGVRIIFQDFETSNWSWDPVAKAYFWHRFYSHQPDLNFDNPAVHDALFKVVDHWFGAGVDGMRLDAVPYLYEREGTSCENLDETHAFLKKLRAYVDEKYPGAMFLAEANQWPEDAAAYFGDGDECHMNFHFPLMPRLFMALRMEDRYPIIDILDQTPRIPDNCQWAVFLRNHDELTLEMVTDEERDYMYRVYAEERQARINLGIRRRLAPLLKNNRRKIELMNALLFSMPGTPVIYYGDEIGMGDNIYLGDRDGVRTPMQWSADRNAGFSQANPQKLFLPAIIDPEYRYESINVEAQQHNPTSLLWWMKRFIAIRKRYKVLGDGELEFLHPNNRKVLAFIRSSENERVLVVANLSRFAQAAEIDLNQYHGMTPVEVFGQTKFPPIGDLPYFITLGPHTFYWFSLEKEPMTLSAANTRIRTDVRTTPTFEITEDPRKWLTSNQAVSTLEGVLADDIPHRRWFRSKTRTIRSLRVREQVPIETDSDPQESVTTFVLLELDYSEGDPETYALPLAFANSSHSSNVFGSDSHAVIARVNLKGSDEQWTLYDAMIDPNFCVALLNMSMRRKKVKAKHGRLVGSSNRTGRKLAETDGRLDVHIPRMEQTNSSVIFENQLIMKLFRRIEPGENPDFEINRHLTEKVGYEYTPSYAGAIKYEASETDPFGVALLQAYMRNEGDGWQYTLDEIGRYYERVFSSPEMCAKGPALPVAIPSALYTEKTPEQAHELFGNYLHSVSLLGQRTAEMHIALATDHGDEHFAPKTFTPMHLRSLYQSLRNSAQRSLQLLKKQSSRLPEHILPDAERLLKRESELMSRLREVTRRKLMGQRIRCHGDYHLGQVLWTGRDFIIIDFEGEPNRSLSVRRLKWTPLRDIAGMVRSFQYAAYTGLQEQVNRGALSQPEANTTPYTNWARYWQAWVSADYLRSYLTTLRPSHASLLPDDQTNLQMLLDAWILEKAMYEVTYELNNRPDWVAIPLRGVLETLDALNSQDQ